MSEATPAPAAPSRLRREVAILVPVALTLLIALSTFTLFSYRNAIDLLIEDRRAEALRTAARLAEEIAAGRGATASEALAARAPRGTAVTLLPSAAGTPLARLLPDAAAGPRPLRTAPPRPGEPGGAEARPGEDPPDARRPRSDDDPAPAPPAFETGTVAGPGEGLGDVVSAFVPVPARPGAPPAADARVLRVDLPAPRLAAQRRGLSVLTWLVVGVDLALAVLVLLFVRHLVSPYEKLLARAREVTPAPWEEAGGPARAGGGGEEIGYLVSTFERALAALAHPRAAADREGTREGELDDREIAALGRTLAASLASGSLLLDRDGRVLAVNRLGAELLGIEPSETTDRTEPPPPVTEHLGHHPELARLLARVVATGEGVSRRECHVERDGETLTLGLTAHPLRRGSEGALTGEEGPSAAGGGSARPNGEAATGADRGDDGEEARSDRPGTAGDRETAVGAAAGAAHAEAAEPAPDPVAAFLVLFADLTEIERKAEEARLAESLARLGELSAGVAHELRNSLATLNGYLTLTEREDDPAVAAEYLAEVRRETGQLERVLEDFLSFARPGSVRLERVPLAAVVERAAADPALAGVPVHTALGSAALAPLSADPELLERALKNLLRNAAEASRAAAGEGAEPDAVEISASHRGGEAEIVVADRGAGVPPEVRERLFRPFATGRQGGLGLGLALAWRIVELHGGHLALEDREGGGTLARMRLPAGEIVTDGSDPRSPTLGTDRDTP